MATESEDDDFFGKVGDVFNGIFDAVETTYNRWLDFEFMRAGGQANTPQPVSYATPQPTVATTAGTYPAGSGPFYGVSTETMVMIAGAAIVALVLLRR